MPIITRASFETYIKAYSNNPAYVLSPALVGQFNYLVDLYQAQLEDLGIFNFTNLEETRSYEVPFCELNYLPIPIWKSISKVEKLEIKTKAKTVLILNTDYFLEPIVINQVRHTNALDFKCLSCSCACERLLVTGIYGVDVPSYVINTLSLIIHNNLGTELSLGGSDCCANIKAKSSGQGSVTYYDKVATVSNIKQSDNIISYPVINRFLLALKRKFIKFY